MARRPDLNKAASRLRSMFGADPPELEPIAPEQPDAPRPKLKKLRIAFLLTGLTVLALAAWIWGVMMAVAGDLPSLESAQQYKKAQNSIVYADDGETMIATLTGNDARILVDGSEISSLVRQAVVAIEDERFYEHRGIDFLGIGRALYQDLLSGSAVQGGSTITQQFVKNALDAQGDRTVLQKLKEVALAYHIEREWTKDRILTNYLNNIYFGEGAYGIEMAARTYFGYNHRGCGEEPRCAEVLRPEEAAMLAALISSPSRYSPLTNPVEAERQRDLILSRMLDGEELEQATAASIPTETQVEPPTAKDDSEFPFFTSWLRQQVVDKYGPGQAFGGGLKITSSLDVDLQRRSEEVVHSYLDGLGPSAAAVVIDNKTGEIKAMVGGLDYEASAFNTATNGLRQPGSSFKPFTLITALESGYGPDSGFTSEPKEISFDPRGPTKSEVFEVNNYDDKYLGATNLADATTYSDNSVYAELGTSLGVDKVVKTAQSMGITSKLPTNPAVILGAPKKGVTPLEMAYAYTTLANGGTKISGTMGSSGKGDGPVAIRDVRSKDGDRAADDLGASGENEPVTEEVLPTEVSETAIEMLHSVVADGTGQSANTSDYTWGKTGTTDANIDAWFCGGVETATACVWVGYPDAARPMLTEFGGLPVDGGTIPARIWHDIMIGYLDLRSEEDAAAAAKRAEERGSDEDATAAPAPEPAPVNPEEVPSEPAPEPPAPEDEPPASDPPAKDEKPPAQAPPADDPGGVTP